MAIDSDPLHCAFTGRWLDLNCGCTCPASVNHALLHWWTCQSTPLFAMGNLEELSDAFNSISAANVCVKQTLIKCAECGRQCPGKDMVVIYKSPTNTLTPDEVISDSHNIVKAVCPEHNRQGVVSYQRQLTGRGYGT